MLWHHALRVNDLPVNLITERVGERVVNDFEGPALVVPDEMLHVLQHERGRFVIVENLGDGEKEIALFYVLETVLASETVLLGDAREAERLAGKATAQDVEPGDVGHSDGMDVAMRFLPEIRLVGLLTEFVPVAGEDALRTRSFKGDAEPANAAKQINEPQRWWFVCAVRSVRNWVFPELGGCDFAAAHASTPLLGSFVERVKSS